MARAAVSKTPGTGVGPSCPAVVVGRECVTLAIVPQGRRLIAASSKCTTPRCVLSGNWRGGGRYLTDLPSLTCDFAVTSHVFITKERKRKEGKGLNIKANQVEHTPSIPYLLMRGGTSKGGYFLKQHLPSCRQAISKLLLTVYGTIQPLPAGHRKLEAQGRTTELPQGRATEMLLHELEDDACSRQVNGIGGATSLTSKAAILSKSTEDGIDVEYLFAQVDSNRPFVDFQPSCGNILSGVGPAAIEMGLVDKEKIGQKETAVKIKAVNTNSIVTAIVQTPGGEITYEGDTRIDGVGGPAAPVVLIFSNVVGSKSGGKLLPTGNLRDTFEGIEVTCIDVAMPMVIARAKSFGKTGYETPEELNRDEEFFKKLEAVRKLAGEAMGYGDVTGSVIPKFAILAEKDDEEKDEKPKPNITARYFVPDSAHAAMSVTGAICLSSCSLLKGSVAHDVYVDFDENMVTEDLSTETKESKKKVVAEVSSQDVSEVDKEGQKNKNVKKVVIGHPVGSIEIVLESEQKEGEIGMTVKSAGVVRTARLIGSGFLRVPSHWWDFDYHEESPELAQVSQKLQSDIDELHKKFVELFRLPVPESAKKTEDSAPQENGSSYPSIRERKNSRN